MDDAYLAGVLAHVGPDNCDKTMFVDILRQTSSMISRGGLETQVGRALVEMSSMEDKDWDTTAFGAAVLEVVWIS